MSAAGRAEAAERRDLLDRLVESYQRAQVSFESLRPFHVRDVLLVASLYDSYTLAEDGRLAEQILGEFHNLSLTAPAYITRVATAERALEALRHRRFDLVITMARVGDLSVQEFGETVRRMHPGLPVYLMTYDTRELAFLEGSETEVHGIDKVFMWRGDVRLFLAVIKLTEDKLNVEHDTAVGQVRVLILVEDSIPFYSSYLPMLFDEIMKQTSSLIQEGVNLTQKLLRMRARPKILLASTYEEAWELYENYREVVLGIISDVRFPREGVVDPEAGVELLRTIRRTDPYTPLVLQSSENRFAETATFLGATFLHKRSPTLLQEFRRFMLDNLGFGDFVFRLPDGTEVGRASDLRQMVDVLETVPKESLQFHGRLNHFSNWLMARTEFSVAAALREKRVHDFDDVDEMRAYLKATLLAFRQSTRRGVVEDFDPDRFDENSRFVRIGGGSLGGKGRGLAFAHELLSRLDLESVGTMRIAVPRSAALGTEVFDQFLEQNDLLTFALHEDDDQTILRRFLAAKMPHDVVQMLDQLLEHVRWPIAVRSSSLLEDSHFQPFAGIYSTLMLPNTNEDREVRLQQLLDAIKFIYASTFFANAKAYISTTPNRMEEEKMGVVIQQIVGRRHENVLYPHVSGVACSWNFYPVERMRTEEGMASIALGLGKTVVEGGRAVRFSPTHPESLPQFSVIHDILENAQRDFWALDLTRPVDFLRPDSNLTRLDLEDAERHGTLAYVGSTYLRENDAVVDGISRDGIRLVTFAPILKHGLAPLAETLRVLLDVGVHGLSGPAEIEFALDLESTETHTAEFAFLQIRPVPIQGAGGDLIGDVRDEDVLARSPHALGNGRFSNIRDILLVPRGRFSREHTIDIASEVEKLNAELVAAGRPYLLIGPGRWGTADRWLGVPVSWKQISGARVILEHDLEDLVVEPSQGTHFFHNMTSHGIGYFHVMKRGGGSLDFAWLDSLKPTRSLRWLDHVRLDVPLEVRIDGRAGEGVILKQPPHETDGPA
ncbi:MAG: histidine kinase [Gemmatimonadetes bacterium]|nr:histidine kinase [Gemmatimonadota bacterium]